MFMESLEIIYLPEASVNVVSEDQHRILVQCCLSRRRLERQVTQQKEGEGLTLLQLRGGNAPPQY